MTSITLGTVGPAHMHHYLQSQLKEQGLGTSVQKPRQGDPRWSWGRQLCARTSSGSGGA